MTEKISKRIRRRRKTRAKIAELGVYRLSVHRTPRHIYAQILTAKGDRVLAAASSVEKLLREQLAYTDNRDSAALIGRTIAERGLAAGVDQVAFDRSGFLYHGRVRALAEAAREAGLKF